MPTYDYRCNACKHEFELFQPITAPVKRKCPECGKNQLERLIGTGAAVLFKGSGFYETDYRSESYKKAAKEESSSGTATEAKLDTKSETKPDAKADSKPNPKSDAKADKKPDAAKKDSAKPTPNKKASKP